MTIPHTLRARLRRHPQTWLLTGCAGFIGSHLLEQLLALDQRVVGMDNFATGSRRNIAAALRANSPEQAARFKFHEADIRDRDACAEVCRDVDVVLHQAALGSVPRSIEDPLRTHDVNVTGFLNVLIASRDAHVRRVVFASSSSVYGDSAVLPRLEDALGRQLSPYAASKLADEIYADVFGRCYGLELIGLRYFNVFGPRQDPNGAYAAVIPRWFSALLEGGAVFVNGDGQTSRDFCFVENVVQANLLAATTAGSAAVGRMFNVGCGERTTLNELFSIIRAEVARFHPAAARIEPCRRGFRAGDVLHSVADIGRARRILGYVPSHSIREGLARTATWYASRRKRRRAAQPSIAGEL